MFVRLELMFSVREHMFMHHELMFTDCELKKHVYEKKMRQQNDGEEFGSLEV